MGKSILHTQELSIGYRNEKEDKVLGEHFNLNLSQGTFVALLGPNGSGKSTLIRSISGLLSPLEGKVFVKGLELSKLTQNQRAKMISVVLTDAIITPGLSVYDVVAYGRFPYTNWLGKLNNDDDQIINESLQLVDMQKFKNRRLSTLSDGERQRVMIAKALAQQSDIMILDEPTAHLDLINRVEIMKLLRQLAHDQNRAILISTHELDLAMQSADQLWLMPSNKKIRIGAPEDLVLNNAMQEVFEQSSVDFDHLTGMFKIKHDIILKMHFESDDEQKELWAKKAFEKIGVALVSNSDTGSEIKYQSQADNWIVNWDGEEAHFLSLGEVIEYVKPLLGSINKKSTTKK